MLKRLYRSRGAILWVNYAAIVRRESAAFEMMWPKFLAACSERDEDNLWKLMDASKEAGCVTIVFAALTLEAMIYDFAASYLTDQYVKEHLDRLDPPSKWVVFSRLVSGHDFPKDHHSFELLQATFRARNELVHAKSVGLHKEGEKFLREKDAKLTKEFYNDFPLQVAKARRAIEEVPLKLYEMTQDTVFLLHIPRKEWPKPKRPVVTYIPGTPAIPAGPDSPATPAIPGIP